LGSLEKGGRGMSFFTKMLCSVALSLICLFAVVCCIVATFYTEAVLAIIVFGILALGIVIFGCSIVAVIWM
jgi:hypothetical protein